MTILYVDNKIIKTNQKKVKNILEDVTKKEDASSGSVNERNKTLGHRTSQIQTTQPIKSQKVFGRNSKISVRYEDGRIIKDIKFIYYLVI